MSQSRFSIVLVGVSALLRRPLVSRLRSADGERSPWVVFAARGCRFDSGFRSAVGLRVHRFRFSARAASEWPLGEFVLPPSASELPFGGLAFGFIASAFRHAPLRSGPRRVGSSAGRVGLWAHRFRFSARADSEWPLGGWPSGLLLRRLPFGGLAFGLTASEIPLGGLAFGFTASAFRHAPIRSGCWASSFFRLPFRRLSSAGWSSGSLLPLFGTHRFGIATRRVSASAFRFGNCPRRVGLRAHRFRFSARTDSEWLLGEFVLPPSASEIALGGLAFGLTASAFRHALLRGCPRRVGASARRVGLRAHRFRFLACAASGLPSAGWPSGSRLPLFGMRRSAPPRRRREGRRSTPTRHLFHFKTLIPTC